MCAQPCMHASEATARLIVLIALYTGDTLRARLALHSSTQPELGTDVSPLALTIKHTARDTLRIKIGDADGKRWEVPTNLFSPPSGGPCLACHAGQP